jgi:hypothetical protein
MKNVHNAAGGLHWQARKSRRAGRLGLSFEPMRAVGLLTCVVAAGCTFGSPNGSPGDAVPMDQQMMDTPSCHGQGFGRVCLASTPTGGRALTGTLDTSVDAICDEIIPINGTNTCVLAGTSVDLAVTSLVRGVGSKPLVIVATGSILIAGTLDAGSQRGQRSGAGAQDATCPGLGLARNDDGGGGGGAGGSYFGAGGDGGVGDLNSNGLPAGVAPGGVHALAFPPTDLRPGCRGGNGGSGGNGGNSGGGSGGRGGGAIYLIAGTEIRISGRLVAYGAGGGGGGVQGGGGGGGSGGLIGLDAPSVIVSGSLAANGGGGGEGGGLGSGVSGEDGTIDDVRAEGGFAISGDGSNNDGGNGGKGSGGTELAGSLGGDNNGGGGGGGGGAGFIYVKGALMLSGLMSPAPTQVP